MKKKKKSKSPDTLIATRSEGMKEITIEEEDEKESEIAVETGSEAAAAETDAEEAAVESVDERESEASAAEAVDEETLAEESVTEETVTEEILTEGSGAEESAPKEVMTEEPGAEGSGAEESVAEETITEETAAEESATEESTAEDSEAEESDTKESGEEEPIVEEPVTKEPAVEEPAPEETAPEEPASQESATEESTTGEPAAEEPVTEESAPKETAPEETEATEPAQKKKLLPIIVVSAIVLVGIILAVTASGLLANKHDKILMALSNTFKDTTRLHKDLRISEISDWIRMDDYTVELSAELEELEFSAEASSKKRDKQIDAKLRVAGIPEVTAFAKLDEERLSLAVPVFSEDKLVYDYRETKSGFLVDTIGKQGVTAFDEILELLHETSVPDKAFTDSLSKLAVDSFKACEIASLDKADYDIGGKKRSCKGFGFTVTRGRMEDFLLGFEELIHDYYQGSTPDVVEDVSVRLRDLRRVMDTDGDLEVKVYIYEEKLAALMASTGEKSLQLTFSGAETRMDDVELKIRTDEKNFRFRQVCDRESDIYTYRYTIRGIGESEISFNVKYDVGDGSLRFSKRGDGEDIVLKCYLESESDSMHLTFKNAEFLDGRISLGIRAGSSQHDVPGNEVDLSSIDRLEMEDKIYDYLDKFEDFLYEYDLDYIIYDMVNAIDFGGMLRQMDQFRISVGAGKVF